MTFTDIVKHIESLPPLSDVVVDIQNLYISGVDAINIDKLIKLIESDPLLTANLLKFVNSPAFGIRRKISSAAQAVTLLGVRMVYAVVMDYAIHERIVADVSAYGVNNEELKHISLMQSRLTLNWLSKVSIEYAKFLSPLAFLMETGKLIIALEVTQSDYTENFRRHIQNSRNIMKYEFELLGTTSYFVSGMLFEHWHFDALFVKILKNMDFKYSELSKKMSFCKSVLKVVRTAINVRGVLEEEFILQGAKLVDKMGLDPKLFTKEAVLLKEHLESL